MVAGRASRRCAGVGAVVVIALASSPAAAQSRVGCTRAQATKTAVGHPTAALAWRARVLRPAPVRARLSGRGRRSVRVVRPRDASWLMVTRAAKDARGRCWVRVRLPWRPSSAAGWVSARRLQLRSTRWRIAISRERRSLTLLRGGRRVLRSRVVIGTPATPTPGGVFAVLWVQPSPARSFVGRWVVGLTAHSRVLDTFAGGDGRVAIHGRGGASLLDPLGSARSHGCVRVPNKVVNRLVRRVGPDELLGVRVTIR